MICYLKQSGSPTRFSGGDRKSLLKMSSSWIHQDPLSYHRLLIYVHTSRMQNVHCPCPPYHFLNPPFHLSFSCPMMTSSPSSRVKVLWSKWGPGVDEFLERGPSLIENPWTKETRYLHTHTRHINTMLDRQRKPQMTFPFESEEDGRCMMPVTCPQQLLNPAGHVLPVFEWFCFLGMIFHGSWLQAPVSTFFLQAIFLFPQHRDHSLLNVSATFFLPIVVWAGGNPIPTHSFSSSWYNSFKNVIGSLGITLF